MPGTQTRGAESTTSPEPGPFVRQSLKVKLKGGVYPG